MKRKIVLFGLAVLILAVGSACKNSTTATTATTTTSTTTGTTVPPPPGWVVEDGSGYGVFYEIFVRSFADSDGDGIGDFNGITAKLDYLQDLGVSTLWLMPITDSPSYHGYDVTDYFAVNPDYGTMSDFENMVDEAGNRGIAIMIDMVFNHTSSQHPWFQEALAGNATYQNYYHLVDSSASLPGAWHTAGNYKYYGYFSSSMPDLNFENPEVLEKLLEISAFWIDKGVQGFRMDAVHHFFGSTEDYEMEGVSYRTNVDWLNQFNTLLEEYRPGFFLLGEIYEEGLFEMVANYYGGVDAPLDFPSSALLRSSANKNSVYAYSTLLKRYYDAYRAVNPDFINFPFIVNHDMNRIATLLGGNEGKIRLVTEMLLTLPGNPIIYYGEEIGMYGAKASGPIYDETRRLPIMWGDSFTADWLDSSDLTLAMLNAQNAEVDDVLTQLADPDSLLRLYQTMIALRENNIALKYGNNLSPYENNNSYVQGFYREVCYQDVEQKVLVLHNFSETGQNIAFPEGARVLYLSGSSETAPISILPGKSTLVLDVTPQE